MKILTTGGRNFKNYAFIEYFLGTVIGLLPDGKSLVIHGGAYGADTMVADYCRKNDIAQKKYNANWKLHGRSAGMIRNKLMLELEKPDLVIAFPGGNGTKHCLSEAKKLGYRTIELTDKDVEAFEKSLCFVSQKLFDSIEELMKPIRALLSIKTLPYMNKIFHKGGVINLKTGFGKTEMFTPIHRKKPDESQ